MCAVSHGIDKAYAGQAAKQMVPCPGIYLPQMLQPR